MRLAFFCGALGIGRDGVGDYARRMAGECIRQGHSCVVVGLSDHDISETIAESQETDGVNISVLRLPRDKQWPEKIDEARKLLNAFDPEWISFQFVPFSYHPKGICFGLGRKLKAINSNARWHLMFHELWLGLGEGAPLKDRIYGVLQRKAIMDLIARLDPEIVNTQAEPYRRVLAKGKISALILPLFSNIPYIAGDGWEGLLEPLMAEAIGKRAERSELYLAGILGGVHPEWNAKEAVDVLLPLTQRSQKKLTLVFHGNNGLPAQAFDDMRAKLKDRAYVVVTGRQSPEDISRIMQTMDIGLATSPRQMIQKSGSAAAMLGHGLKMLVTRNDWRLRGFGMWNEKMSAHILFPEDFKALETLPVRDANCVESNSVKEVAAQLLESMTRASSPRGTAREAYAT